MLHTFSSLFIVLQFNGNMVGWNGVETKFFKFYNVYNFIIYVLSINAMIDVSAMIDVRPSCLTVYDSQCFNIVW